MDIRRCRFEPAGNTGAATRTDEDDLRPDKLVERALYSAELALPIRGLESLQFLSLSLSFNAA